MPDEHIDTSMFAPCGMNCKACYKHCYHRKPCAGCLNSDQGKPEHCRKCKIKDCIKEKSLSYCFDCSEYPCRLIKNLEKSYNKRYQASLIENSRFVQEYGLDCFMEQQKEKYTRQFPVAEKSAVRKLDAKSDYNESSIGNTKPNK